MKIIKPLLLFGICFGGCHPLKKQTINFLSEASSLKIPGEITEIEYQYVKSDDYNYPYDFILDLIVIVSAIWLSGKQIFFGSQPGVNDANLYISSRMLAKRSAIFRCL